MAKCRPQNKFLLRNYKGNDSQAVCNNNCEIFL